MTKKIKLTLPIGEVPVTGKQISFVAPCDCSVVECLQIDGVNYCVVDAMGNKVTQQDGGGVWDIGAKVSVILDCDYTDDHGNRRAYLLNGNTPPIRLEKIREICT